jgi:hypothetical protein
MKNDNILYTYNIKAFKNDIYTMKNDNILYTKKLEHPDAQK